jgi:hypothetical protein
MSVVAEPDVGMRGCPGQFEQGGLIGGRQGKSRQLYQVGGRLVLEICEEVSQAIAQFAEEPGLDGPARRLGPEALVRRRGDGDGEGHGMTRRHRKGAKAFI